VNEEALVHWGAIAPKTNKQTNAVTTLTCNFLCIFHVSLKHEACIFVVSNTISS